MMNMIERHSRQTYQKELADMPEYEDGSPRPEYDGLDQGERNYRLSCSARVMIGRVIAARKK